MRGSWLNTIHEVNNPNLNLFCFPYSGGSALTFQKWPDNLLQNVNLYSAQLPGRPNNMHEELNYDMHKVVTAITNELLPLLNRDYIFFGHSLGAKVAFEIASLLESNGHRPACCFIASASGAPSATIKRPPIHHLSDTKFSEELKALGGTPEIILNNEEFMNFFRPVLRADFKLSETYEGTTASLSCESHVLYGRDDTTISKNEINLWKQHFVQETVFHEVPGGHFFIEKQPKQTLSIVNQVLASLHNFSSTLTAK
jgi:surfactin synthase thioesterase subunit